MMRRSDWQLIRFLEQQLGREEAARVQALPYIEISEDVVKERVAPFLQPLFEGESSNNVCVDQDPITQATLFGLAHLPWQNFVMRVPMLDADLKMHPHMHGFAVVRGRVEEISAIDHKSRAKQHNRCIFAALHVASWRPEEAGRIIAALPIAYDMDTGNSLEHQAMSKNDKGAKLIRALDVMTVITLAYLALCPERTVCTQSTERPGRQLRKAIAKDISERVDLPTHILIDPSRAPDYQPPGMRPVFDALAQARKPHARRAHWRRLPERVVRVREAWIGCREWEHAGRTYKVISPPGDRAVDKD